MATTAKDGPNANFVRTLCCSLRISLSCSCARAHCAYCPVNFHSAWDPYFATCSSLQTLSCLCMLPEIIIKSGLLFAGRIEI